MVTLLPPENLLLPSKLVQNEEQDVVSSKSEELVSDVVIQKKKKIASLLASPPESLASLRGPGDLQNYNLDALKKIARMGAVALPKAAPRAVCVDRLTQELFGQHTLRTEEEEDVHTVNLSCRA